MYTKPVDEIIKQHKIKYHCYANDTQVYMTLNKFDDVSSSIEACIRHKYLDEQHAETE